MDTPWSVNATAVLPVNYANHVRNRVYGSFGVLSGIAAVVMLWSSGRLRLPLKATLISMSLSDILTMCIAVVWSPDLPCWPGLYNMGSAIVVSNLMTTLTAFHNCVAVFFPARYKQILGFGPSLILVVSCWICGYLIILACLGTQIPNGSSCYLVAAMPRAGLVMASCACLLCCCLTIVMSIAVLKRIRKIPQQKNTTVPLPRTTDELNQLAAVPEKNMSTNSRPNSRQIKTSSAAPISSSSSSFAQHPMIMPTRTAGFLVSKTIPRTTPRSVSSEEINHKNSEKKPHRYIYLSKLSKCYQSLPQKLDEHCETNMITVAYDTHDHFKTDSTKFDHDVHGSKQGLSSAGSPLSTADLALYENTDTSILNDFEGPNLYSNSEKQHQMPKVHSLQHKCKNSTESLESNSRDYNPITFPLTRSLTYHGNSSFNDSDFIHGNAKEKNRSLIIIPKTKDNLLTHEANRNLYLDSDSMSIETFLNTAENAYQQINNHIGEKQPESQCGSNYLPEAAHFQASYIASLSNISKSLDWSTYLCSKDFQSCKFKDLDLFPVYQQLSQSSTEIGPLKHQDKPKKYGFIQSQAFSYKCIRTKTAPNIKRDLDTPVLLQFKNTLNCTLNIQGQPAHSAKKTSPGETERCLSANELTKTSDATEMTYTSIQTSNSLGFLSSTSEGVSVSARGDIHAQERHHCRHSQVTKVAKFEPASPPHAEELAISNNISKISSETSSDCNEAGKFGAPKFRPTRRTASRKKSHSSKRPPRSCSSYCKPKTKRGNWRRRTQYTLVVLCCWCCLLSLPYIIYAVYVSTLIEDRTKFANSGFGIMVSCLTMLNSLSDPVLFAFRFVEWRAAWNLCCRKRNNSYFYH
ncbi:hypothetical protein ElyMa_002032700 [Elysia marginata]|uniref:G-protein coupled receptors family 1 profile domain-containing protein n=1 Tax=Elysia marginata TaxID=1093978 RepID=A0AAV4F679_9GAST|nr:hypothetical protein ElyMa_002032700 [Elysia marginata]